MPCQVNIDKTAFARRLQQGSPITGKNTRALPREALEQTVIFDEFAIQSDFDFGA